MANVNCTYATLGRCQLTLGLWPPERVRNADESQTPQLAANAKVRC